MKLFTLCIVCITFQYTLYADEPRYEHPTSGISFHYPGTLTVNKESSTVTPFSTVFTYGRAPFSISVIFKEVEGGANLQSFIEKEHARQREGGYKKDVVEKNAKIDQNINAVEWIRKTPFETIYYFVFSSPKSHKLYAFYHFTSKNADPDQVALKAYEIMKKSLVIEK